MKKTSLIVALAVSAASAFAQSSDPVVMRIAGQDVPRSEFEYNYNKNNSDGVVDRKDMMEYVDLFINYKLKVQAAIDAQLDTLSSFKEEFKTYRDQQIAPLLVVPGAEEQEVRNYYDGMLRQLDGHDLRMPAHIFLRLPQNAEEALQKAQKERIDSIYQALQNGANFEELATKCSEDPQSAARGGLLQWFGPGQLVPEFEKVMYELQKGELSAPFLSPVGYHIVLLKDVKQLEPFEELRPQILNFLQQRGLSDHLAKAAVDTLAAQRGTTTDAVLDAETERLCAEDMELKYLVQEYHDGLLLYEYCKTNVWDPAQKDSVGMEKYFKKHKKQYAWDEPHFYGMVYYAREEGDVAAVKKLLKGVPESKWTSVVREHMNKDSVTVRMEQRLFKKGDNAYIDSLVFKVKEGKTPGRKGFPYTGVVGRVLKKGPKVWTDVSSQVATDYQMECDNKFAEELRKRYEVVTYPEVLETVNKH